MFVESLKSKIDQRENRLGATAKCLHIFMNPSRLERDFLCEDYSIKLVRSAYAVQKLEAKIPLTHVLFSVPIGQLAVSNLRN